MSSTLRPIAKALIRPQSVRDELNVAYGALRRAVRSFGMEWSKNSDEFRGRENIKINVGCGNLICKGWVNIDVSPGRGASYVDVVNGLPFAAGAAAHIHCEHFLEHLSFDQAEEFLAECSRVLASGGTLRIIVPDAEKYIREYCAEKDEFFGQLRRLGGAVRPLDTPIKVINQMFRMGGAHKFAWDFATLLVAAKEAGFSHIVRSSRGDVPADLAIDGMDDWRQIESLYATATK